MLLKCVTARASLIVPDLEDSVPHQEKEAARKLIKTHIPLIRKAMGDKLVLTIRTNAVQTGMFEDDVKQILDEKTVHLIDGFCVTKVDTVEMASEICKFLSSQEKKFGLKENQLKVIP